MNSPVLSDARTLRGKVFDVSSASVLYDPSGGRGITLGGEKGWIIPDDHNARDGISIGYAGGIGPDNVEAIVEALHATGADKNGWIDMESGGAALAGHLNHSLPVLSIRGVSDHADGARSVGPEAQRVAARNAAVFAAALATHLV